MKSVARKSCVTHIFKMWDNPTFYVQVVVVAALTLGVGGCYADPPRASVGSGNVITFPARAFKMVPCPKCGSNESMFLWRDEPEDGEPVFDCDKCSEGAKP